MRIVIYGQRKEGKSTVAATIANNLINRGYLVQIDKEILGKSRYYGDVEKKILEIVSTTETQPRVIQITTEDESKTWVEGDSTVSQEDFDGNLNVTASLLAKRIETF